MNNNKLTKIQAENGNDMFSFPLLNEWDNFDFILYILLNNLGYKVVKMEDEAWYKNYKLKNKKHKISLAHDEMFGNIIYSSAKKQKKVYEDKLETVANEILAIVDQKTNIS